MTWRLAHALEKLRLQVNATWPSRGKDSDGSIGDESHSARESDHNPNSAHVVCAIDITHSPDKGFDSYAFADMLLRRQDPRMAYVISNRRIGSGPAGPQPGVWRKYSGKNPHDHHCHISVRQVASSYDDARDWAVEGVASPSKAAVSAYVAPPATLRSGASGPAVETMQARLNAHGAALAVDGDFGAKTAEALASFQTASGLNPDAICGPMTWRALA